MTPRRLTALTAALAASLTLAACGGDDDKDSSGSSGASSGGGTEYKLAEYSIDGPATLKAGKVSITAKNDGHIEHELVILKTDKKADALGSGAEVPEDGAVGEIEDLGAGKSESKDFDLQPGHYALICNIAGHYAGGMHADLTVE